MSRGIALLTIGLVVSTSAWAQDLPIPPIPPVGFPASEPAPVPDPDIRAPIAQAALPRLRPAVFSAERPDVSLGFAPGSRYQTTDERRPLQTPGLLLTVPLQ
jgi:hypothetical protein